MTFMSKAKSHFIPQKASKSMICPDWIGFSRQKKAEQLILN